MDIKLPASLWLLTVADAQDSYVGVLQGRTFSVFLVVCKMLVAPLPRITRLLCHDWPLTTPWKLLRSDSDKRKRVVNTHRQKQSQTKLRRGKSLFIGQLANTVKMIPEHQC